MFSFIFLLNLCSVKYKVTGAFWFAREFNIPNLHSNFARALTLVDDDDDAHDPQFSETRTRGRRSGE